MFKKNPRIQTPNQSLMSLVANKKSTSKYNKRDTLRKIPWRKPLFHLYTMHADSEKNIFAGHSKFLDSLLPLPNLIHTPNNTVYTDI